MYRSAITDRAMPVAKAEGERVALAAQTEAAESGCHDALRVRAERIDPMRRRVEFRTS